MNPTGVTSRIRDQRAIPVVRSETVDSALSICSRLVSVGIDVIELTATIPGWKEALATAVGEWSTATIGMGTITSRSDADLACEMGASFLVSPFPAPHAREIATAQEVLFLEGAFTPAEVAASAAFGPCKLFPASVGGIGYLKSLKSILPHSQIMPTGGIGIEDIGTWLAAGAFAVGIGRDLYEADDFDDAVGRMNLQLGRN